MISKPTRDLNGNFFIYYFSKKIFYLKKYINLLFEKISKFSLKIVFALIKAEWNLWGPLHVRKCESHVRGNDANNWNLSGFR